MLGQRSRGLALIAVLGVLALLTVLALGAADLVRKRGYSTRTSIGQTQNAEYADSAIRLALLEISDPIADGGSSIPNRLEVEVFQNKIPVEISWEAGRIDLNAADDLLLYAYFASHGLSDSEAHGLAARVLDWRDADDDRSFDGAETNEYLARGQFGPRNAPFESVSEVREVLGGESLSDELLDGLTVYSRSRNVRPSVAPEGVIEALRWAQAHKLGDREWIDAGVNAQVAPASAAGEVIRLRACVKEKAEVCRVAIMRITGSREHPALIYAWYSELRVMPLLSGDT